MRRGPAATAFNWVGVAGGVGLAISLVFSSLLHLPRGPFVLVHAVATFALAALFLDRSEAHLARPGRRGPAAAVAVGLLLGGILVMGVVSGPEGASPTATRLVAALGWYGVVYGIADALLLTIIPVRAVGARSGPAGTISERLRWGGVALGASLLVTALYHAGFAEYRGAALVQPLIGNTVVTVGYLLTGHPATPLLAHVLMHGAAVIHGMEATTQLPPHY
jgi:hypothetical protein